MPLCPTTSGTEKEKKSNDTELLETILLEVSISPSHHKCLFSQDHTIRTPR